MVCRLRPEALRKHAHPVALPRRFDNKGKRQTVKTVYSSGAGHPSSKSEPSESARRRKRWAVVLQGTISRTTPATKPCAQGADSAHNAHRLHRERSCDFLIDDLDSNKHYVSRCKIVSPARTGCRWAGGRSQAAGAALRWRGSEGNRGRTSRVPTAWGCRRCGRRLATGRHARSGNRPPASGRTASSRLGAYWRWAGRPPETGSSRPGPGGVLSQPGGR